MASHSPDRFLLISIWTVMPVVAAIMTVETTDMMVRAVHLPSSIEKQVMSPTPAGTKKNERCFSMKLLTSSIMDSFTIPVSRRKSRSNIPITFPGMGRSSALCRKSPRKHTIRIIPNWTRYFIWIIFKRGKDFLLEGI